MPNPVQWTADQFWSQMQSVASAGRAQKQRLADQKLALQHAYSAARAASDADTMAALNPLIHENSVLRIRYSDLARQFNALMEQARSLLEQHGVHEVPVLAGLGQLETIVVAAAWVTALGILWGIVHEIDKGIKTVGEGLAKLSPASQVAFSLAPLALIAAAIFLVPKFLARRAA